MYLKSHELGLLEDLGSLLRTFSEMTDLTSSNIASLSLIPLKCSCWNLQGGQVVYEIELWLAEISQETDPSQNWQTPASNWLCYFGYTAGPKHKKLGEYMTYSEKENPLYAVIDSKPTAQTDRSRTNVDDDEKLCMVGVPPSVMIFIHWWVFVNHWRDY